MRLVINQQVLQREEQKRREKQQQETETAGALQRSKSVRTKGDAGKGFFSFFKDK